MIVSPRLPGVGGMVKVTPEDFLVEEIPAYLPSGSGPHTYLFIEKRALTTEEAILGLCRATGIARDAVGAAGMKDRQAVTRQWISMPELDPEAALLLDVPGVKILSAARHGNKLRTGHLRGNRFVLTLRGITCPQPDAIARVQAIFAALRTSGLPNRYGAQRFGARGDNAARGRHIVLGERADQGSEQHHGRKLGRSERRLLVSAFQSELFNRYLDLRLAEGSTRVALAGDVLRRRDSGGLFAVAEADLADAARRLEAQELDVTGPMFGPKMVAPTEGSVAAAREQALLDDAGVLRAAFARLGALAEGTRRPLTVPVEDPEVAAGDSPDSLRLAFGLPSGAYATVLIDELS